MDKCCNIKETLMRIIHCADLHLESSLKSILTGDKSKERRDELLHNFDRLVDYANDNSVDIILVAGDIFDNGKRRKTAIRHIIDLVKENPDIDFVFLKGNHDTGGVFDDEYEIPDNVKLFDQKNWKKYEFGDVVIKGVELTKDNYKNVALSLVLDPGKCNIVTLHAGLANHEGNKEAYEVNLNDLKNKNIDYLALGHIHKYEREELDDKGIYVYPGCLEGRGFDEVGPKGFVLLDIGEDGKVVDTFVPFAKREIHREEVMITPEDTMPDIIGKVESAVSGISDKDLVEIILVGKTNMDELVDIDTYRIKKTFEDSFYLFKIKDNTTVDVDYASFANDKSLKGEFIRLLEKEDLEDEDKSIIVELGIKALKGEHLDI